MSTLTSNPKAALKAINDLLESGTVTGSTTISELTLILLSRFGDEHAHETEACLWQRDYPDNKFFFTTGCGQEGVNKETSYLFCPYCGKKLTTNRTS